MAKPPPLSVAPERKLPPQLPLAGFLVAELLLFAVAGDGFASAEGLGQLVRHNAALAIVALAMTGVILTGGIDLSVGSTLGLSAVLFGKMWRDGHVPAGVAAVLTLGVGAVAGLVNGTVITRLRVHPLIVTLATLSLYRGIAQGITGGSENYTGFSSQFLALGDVPAQLLVTAFAAVAFYLLVHRSTVGRAWSAIGFAPEGARYAGIPVRRRVALAYVLSGLSASAAAVLYVARVGQAKADAGTGYELSAITAVVLGGTSIFGGRGSVGGTLLGVAAIAVLEAGLRSVDGPPQLAGVATGVLLLVAIGRDGRPARHRPVSPVIHSEEPEMRNTQLAVLCGVIVVAALIVVGGNAMLVRRLAAAAPASAGAKHLTIGLMPKSVGNAYFINCHQGATEAADALGDTLLWDGPTGTDPAKQNEVIDAWTARGVDAIAVSVENRDSLSIPLKAAMAKGIKVVTWDADATPDARDWFVNQATPQGIGNALTDAAAATMGNKGHFVIVTATLTAANQNEWIKYVRQRLAEKYPDMVCDSVQPCDDLQAKALSVSQQVLNSSPDVKLLMAVSSQAVPGCAEAVKQSGRTDVHVVGLGLPNENKPYVHQGYTTAVILWKTADLGYLTVQAADAACRGTLKPGAATFPAGRLGTVQVNGTDVMLGKPFVFDKANIDGFDF